jgi:hypothetical protein
MKNRETSHLHMKRFVLIVIACTLLAAQAAIADYVFGDPTAIAPIYSKTQRGASMSADGLELYYDAFKSGRTHLWVRTRATTEDTWGDPVNLGPAVNSSSFDWGPRISADGLELYFTSNRESSNKYTGFQIYVSRRQSIDDPWQPAENLGPEINRYSEQTIGSISSDGLELYFTSGGTVRMATRETKYSPWTDVMDLTPMTESTYPIRGEYPAISPGGLHLLYATNWPTGLGDLDLWMMSRASIHDKWSKPVNIGAPINTVNQESRSWISYDGLSVLYTSDYFMYQVSILSGADFYAPAPEYTQNPIPKDSAKEVVYNGLALSWEAGCFAASHDLYLGLSRDEISNATTDSATYLGRLYDTTYVLDNLAFDQTYYWRVDEVNAAPDSTVFKGTIWSFTVEPLAKPIETIAAMASSAKRNMGPRKTIDGSGLDQLDQHSTDPTDMWLANDSTDSWIQYEFDTVYKLHELWIWNSNQAIESFIGFGVKDALIETSVDGLAWTQIVDVPTFAQADGIPTHTANTVVDLSGVAAKYVRIIPQSSFGVSGQTGLSEVRFYTIPNTARELSPTDGTTTESSDVMLSWYAGREAAIHEIYLGSDPDHLDLVGVTKNTSLLAEALEYNQTYYWQVIEVNEAQTPSAYASDIQSFTTPVDVMEADVTVDYSGSISLPVTNVTATASGGAPERTVDGTGLNGSDQHSINHADMWLTTFPSWVQYEFDEVYTLHEMWVWNSNQAVERFLGFGVKDAMIETSLDGTTWTQIPDLTPFAQASGQPTYTANTVVDLTGIRARYIRISPLSTYGNSFSGLSEVRFYYFATDGQ